MSIAAASPIRGTRRAAGGSSEYSTVAMTPIAGAGGEQHLGRAWRKAHDPLRGTCGRVIGVPRSSVTVIEPAQAAKRRARKHRAELPHAGTTDVPRIRTRVRIAARSLDEAIRPCYLMEPGRRIILRISATCTSSAAI